MQGTLAQGKKRKQGKHHRRIIVPLVLLVLILGIALVVFWFYTRPELTLEGGEVVMNLGDEYREPGYTAKANDDEDLTARVTTSSTEFVTAGTHDVVYRVADDEGRYIRAHRKVKVLPNTGLESGGIVICMYHYVYDENDPPDDLHRRYGNYISSQALTEEIRWLQSENYYFPTWTEVREFTEGKRILPDKSIVLTFDDGEKDTLKQLIPVLNKCRVPATCFLITSKKGDTKVTEYTSQYLTYQSHTHDMHRSGHVKGHRGIFSVIEPVEGLPDLKKSIEICGSSDAFAYPYGDYSDSAEEMLREAGFLCAVTTQPGRVYPGDDPLLLPRQRMSLGQSLETFQSKVAPPEREETQASADADTMEEILEVPESREITTWTLESIASELEEAGLDNVDVFRQWVEENRTEEADDEESEESGFTDADCRMTAMLLAGSHLTSRTVEEKYTGDYLMFDVEAIESDSRYSMLKKDEKLFTTLFGEKPVSKNGFSETLPENWKRHGISFDLDNCALISVMLPVFGRQEAYVGHTGILVDRGEEAETNGRSRYLFVEKLAFQDPFMMTELTDEKELIALFSSRPEYQPEDGDPPALIYRNDELMGVLRTMK